MVKCLCHHCKNRAVGCHKFCPDYRKYRRELEEQQSLINQDKRAERVYFKSLLKDNFKRK